MIQFPLKIDVYRTHDGLWKAESCSVEYYTTGQTAEHALGAMFLSLKSIPGFQLWTFNIVVADDSERRRIEKEPRRPKPDVSKYEMDVFVTAGKINAIKAYRERTGLGLKESKDAIEEMASRLGTEPPPNYVP